MPVTDYGQIIEANRPHLMGMIRKKGVKDPEVMEDVMQMAALKAVERYDPSKGASFLTYLIGQVWSATVSEKRKRHPLTASGNQRMIVVPLTRADLVPAIDDGYSRVEDEEHIRWAFAEMEAWLAGQPSELTITYIGKLSGLRVPDIAAALDVPETRVSTYLRVASRKFSQILGMRGRYEY